MQSKSQLRNRLDPWWCYVGFYFWARNLCNGLGYHLQHLDKHARPKDTYARLISFFWVTNQDCILIIQNISFPKIMCKPNLRWHFGIECRYSGCQLTSIFSFKNVTWHFGFEVERQMKFVKHRHWKVASIHVTGSEIFNKTRRPLTPISNTKPLNQASMENSLAFL